MNMKSNNNYGYYSLLFIIKTKKIRRMVLSCFLYAILANPIVLPFSIQTTSAHTHTRHYLTESSDIQKTMSLTLNDESQVKMRKFAARTYL